MTDYSLYAGVHLSRPWLVLGQLSLFFTQPIATAMSFAPDLPSVARVLTQAPRSLAKYAC